MIETADEQQGTLMRVPDISKYLGIPESQVRHLVARRQIPTRRLGRRVVALRAELEQWAAELPTVGEDNE